MVGLEDLLNKRLFSKSSRPTIYPVIFHICRLTSAPLHSLQDIHVIIIQMDSKSISKLSTIAYLQGFPFNGFLTSWKPENS